MKVIQIKNEYIKLGQALKLGGIVSSGVDAKNIIQEGQVSVNGNIETQRGKKLHVGDIVSYNGETMQISQ